MMPLIASGLLIIALGIHLGIARVMANRLPERVIVTFFRWPWSPTSPPLVVSRRWLLRMGPTGALIIGLLGVGLATSPTPWTAWSIEGSAVLQIALLAETLWTIKHVH